MESKERLSDQKLIADVISDGRCGRGACERAGLLLAGYGSAGSVVTLSGNGVDGPAGRVLTPAEQRRLVAAKELAKRVLASELADRQSASTPAEVAQYAAGIAFYREEVLLLLGIDSRNRVCGQWEISRGWEAGINVHPRQIFSIMVRESLGRGVIVHNHPSGNPTPSDEDIHFTARMIEGGQILGIDLLDHVIVAASGFFSMRANCRNLEFSAASG